MLDTNPLSNPRARGETTRASPSTSENGSGFSLLITPHLRVPTLHSHTHMFPSLHLLLDQLSAK